MAFKKGDPNINRNGRVPGSTSYKAQVQQTFLDIMSKDIKVGKTTTKYYQAFLENFLKEGLNPNSKAFAFLAERLMPEHVLDDIDARLNRSKREDEDFLNYRIYKSCHDYQQKVLVSMEKLILLLAGRRAGKTEADIKKAISVAIKPGSLVLYIGLTVNRCLDLFWNGTIDGLTDLGLEIESQSRTEGRIVLVNGSEIHFNGNTDKAERDKLRGSKWDLVIIDEVQSQKGLVNLIDEIIEPTLMDRKGQLILSGTGPKVRGTYWETMWSDTERFPGLRLNWNITNNPFIVDYKTVLDDIKAKKGLTDNSPLFIREYLGRICYDDDAMVFRMSDSNIYTDEQLRQWVDSQPTADIKFTAGLDYGFSDSDAFVIICYSESSNEKFVLYEYKMNRTGITELATAIKEGINKVINNPIFNKQKIMYNGPFQETTPDIDKFFYIYCDTNEQKISVELRNQYGLNTNNAYKYDKGLAIELLQEEIRRGDFKLPSKSSIFYDESLKTIWKRDDNDNLTREIDDDAYHPDMMDAIIYALRDKWRYSNQ